MKLSQRIALLALLILLPAVSGCGVYYRIRAKYEINEGARAFKANRFNEAEQHFARANELDPNQRNALMFIAHSIRAQYRQGVDTDANKATARRAIEAYQRVLERDPTNDDAYNSIAFLYGALNDEQAQRQLISQRAESQTASPEQRAAAYVVLASMQRNCSFTITEQPEIKQTVMREGRALIQYRMPQDRAKFDEARRCATEGLRLINLAIDLTPNNESAWSQKTGILREMAKLAEMEGNTASKDDYTRQADQAQERATQLNQERIQREQSQASPSPPSG